MQAIYLMLYKILSIEVFANLA